MWVCVEDRMEMRALGENGNVHCCHPEIKSTLEQRWKVGLGPMVVRHGHWDRDTLLAIPRRKKMLSPHERFRMDTARQPVQAP